jgi:hypothetical protein
MGIFSLPGVLDYPVHVGVGVAVTKGKSFLGFAAK